MMTSYQELNLLTLESSIGVLFGFHEDVHADLDFNNLLNLETMLDYYHTLTNYRTGFQVLLPRQCT